MGQYYNALVIDENGNAKVFHTVGMKLTEHSWIDNYSVNGVMKEIYNSPKRVAWIGDYANEPDDAFGDMTHEEYIKMYDLAWRTAEDKVELFKADWCYDDEPLPSWFATQEEIDDLTTGTYLINHTFKIYMSFDEYKNEFKDNDWITHPLSLLTACGNGRGGGDFWNSNEGYRDVGSWAFCLIELSKKEPDGYMKDSYFFKEK